MVFFTSRSILNTGVSAGDLEVGKEVLINENGAPVNYLVVQQGLPSDMYDASCDGTWLLRKDIAENRPFDAESSNVLENSDIQSWINSTMLERYDANVQANIKQVKIPYRQNGGPSGTDKTGSSGLSCKVFLLSSYEAGWTTENNSNFPIDGSVLSYFYGTSITDSKRIAYFNETQNAYWLRSPNLKYAYYVWIVITNGGYGTQNPIGSCGVRPCIILPFDFEFTGNQIVS